LMVVEGERRQWWGFAVVVWQWCWWWRFGCWRASFENGGEAMFAGWGCEGKGAKVVVVWL